VTTKDESKRFTFRLRRRNKIYRWLPLVADLRDGWELARSVRKWRESGLPSPAPHPIKRALIVQEGRRIRADTLVETGTFTGDTVRFCQKAFQRIYSVEVQAELATIAAQRFSADPGVMVLQGDSAKLMPEIVAGLTGSVVFWLDGHYMGGASGRGDRDCPIFDELKAIAAKKPRRFSIIIDDLRLFGTDPAYPSLDSLHSTITNEFPELGWETALDIVWCRWGRSCD